MARNAKTRAFQSFAAWSPHGIVAPSTTVKGILWTAFGMRRAPSGGQRPAGYAGGIRVSAGDAMTRVRAPAMTVDALRR